MPPEVPTVAAASAPPTPSYMYPFPSPPRRPTSVAFSNFCTDAMLLLPNTEPASYPLAGAAPAAAAPAAVAASAVPARAGAEAVAVAPAAPVAQASATPRAVGVFPTTPATADGEAAGEEAIRQTALAEVWAAATAPPAPTIVAAVAAQAATAAMPLVWLPQSYHRDNFEAAMAQVNDEEILNVGSSRIKLPKITGLANSRGGCSTVGRPCNRDLRGPAPVTHGIERFAARVRCPVVKSCRFESVGVQFPSTPFLYFFRCNYVFC